MRQSAVVFLLVAFAAVSLAAATPPPRSSFEQVLLPMALINYVQGAGGSLWTTEFTGFNNGTQPAVAFQRQCVYYCTCDANPCFPGSPVPAQTQFTIRPTHETNPANQGIFIYVEKERASDIAYNLVIREFAHGSTALPVVRERDFRSGTTILPSVPISVYSRTRLRIYGMSSPGGAGVLRVRVVPADATAPREIVVSLGPPSSGSRLAAADEFPEQPAYVDAGDLNRLVSTSTNVRLEIESLTPGLVYWPLVTVTANDSQHLMTVTPQ